MPRTVLRDTEAAQAVFANARSVNREPLILAPRIGLPAENAGLLDQLAPEAI